MTDAERAWIHNRGTAYETTEGLRESIRGLVDDVRTRGDAALIDALQTFDGVAVDADGLRVSDDEFAPKSDFEEVIPERIHKELSEVMSTFSM